MTRTFTEEERKRIVSIPITMECFDFPRFVYNQPVALTRTKDFIKTLDYMRKMCAENRNGKADQYFEALVSMLPSTYNVVRL